MPDDEQQTSPDVKVEELSLDELEEQEGEGKAEGPATTGGLRAGGLGPEGARYVPPMAARRRTVKPLIAAVALFVAAGLGISGIALQGTLESRVAGDTFTLRGVVLDQKEYLKSKEVPIPGVNVTVKALGYRTVSDAKGEFTVTGLKGGKYSVGFFMRDWDTAINTTFVSFISGSWSSTDDPKPFPVKVNDLDPRTTRPDSPFSPTVQVRVLDWPIADSVRLGLRASSFDRTLEDLLVTFREASGAYSGINIPYADSVTYTFKEGTGSADYSQLFLKVLYPDGIKEFVGETRVSIPSHPAGTGGWRTVAYPDVGLFVTGGGVTNGSDPTVVVAHSTGATECAYRIDGGAWGGWLPMTGEETDVHVTFAPALPEGDHLVEVMARNATLDNGTVKGVHVTLDRTPPMLAPTVIGGEAVAPWAQIDLQSEGANAFRYRMPDGSWVPWQLVATRVLVPLPDTGAMNVTVDFQAIDLAGNVATGTARVGYMAIPHETAQEYDQYKTSLNVCIPVMVIGVVMAAYGGLMAWRRRRPGMAMLGAIGALLAGGLGILGAILAVVALAAITLSRDEFEETGAPPPKDKGGTPEE